MPSTNRAPAWLPALLAAALVLYTDDYVIAGVLPELARDLGVSEAAAGQLVTVFSLTVAIAAPVAAVVLARVPRRPLFAAALLVFAAANLAAAATPSFSALLGWRVLAAVAAASLTPAIFAYAAQHAPPVRTGRYIAIVSLGVTGSIALGEPLGTWIGGALSWRTTFVVVAAAGLAALVAVLVTLPRQRVRAPEPPPLVAQLRTLLRAPISLGLLANGGLMTGSMMMLTYLAPYLTAATGTGVDERAVAFGLAGVAGMLGIWLGGVATDRWGADTALLAGIGAIVATMVGLWALWLARPAPLVAVLAVATVWGAAAFWNSPAIQARLHALAGPLAPRALALNTSATYLGVALGGAIGGAVLATSGIGALPVVAAAFGLVAAVLLAPAARTARAAAARER